ncbi:DNA translocase FtsK [Exiguobacterium alkaliphilum]|uniref:FtsK/SpoIIIE domain-containing protein n=2 Tax=Exiguobacterium TaxID=33986 RepID=A0ABT2KSL5_9BACL|nr:DNA translocase FtsK [Exiguobacterium alkaliphilum]MCT4793983.1 FtsK/SpoIIIE domain-containing protein [Exiguobacterium alkaliphilum]
MTQKKVAQKSRKTPPKRKRPAPRARKKQPIPWRTYGWGAFVLAMTAFIFSLFEFGWVGARTSLLAATLFGGWGALTYLAIGFTLLIGLSDWRPSQRAGIFLLFLAFLLFGDLVWGAERGAINGALYELNHYLLSDFGIIFLGIICLVVGISLLSPSIWYSVGRRLLESGQAIKQEWQERERPERKTAPARKKATPAVPRDAEASSNPPEIEPEPDAVTMHDIPIVGFSEQVVAEKREQKQDASTTDRADEVADMPTEDMMMTAAQDVSDTYELPTFTILSEPVVTDLSGENARLKANATKLVQTLKSFGVGVKVLKIHLGPTVTKYELQPDIGVKVSRITSLSDDLALALAAKDIRIEAPIPGKAAIGIEVPNQEVAPVCLREVLEADTVKREASPLLVALGRSISGETVTVALNKMPHLLVAGSTGSGKSVCINGMIVSILMRTRPDEVRLMMIDPKMVELNVYNGVPHLLTPVVTDPKKAAQALKQVVAEMERRYELFSRYGVRNIEGYNELVDKSEDEDAKRLPFIVVIVDELADLMMVASNDVEDAIMRLAQMARAAGIHMVLATQRPSVDVITGVIKANIPSRIAFAVSSQTDSRTILDGGGAEKLLGRGDMLMLANGMNKPIRVQGAFVSDQEVETVVNHVIAQQRAQYVEAMMPKEEEVTTIDSDDSLFGEVVQFIMTQETASTSMIQRRFRIGYNRAARLIDSLEQAGYVGPSEGSKPRKVLVNESEG